jgi:hypothetical protein
VTTSGAAEVTRSWERYLRESAVAREVIDDFIQRLHWAMFDPELGYILHNSLVQWGVSDSRTIETQDTLGERVTVKLVAMNVGRLSS